MKKSILMLSIIAIVSVLSGCAAAGLTASTHRTDVGLSANNYRIIATNVVGEASSEGILGASFGVGMGASQFSIIPLTPDRTLYKIAMQNLWANFELKNGSPANRTLALVNLRYDSETLNTFLYTKLKVIVVADVVEFK
jgi:hypothetical protein